MSGRSWRLRLPFEKPPLSQNDRQHWATKAKLTKQIRTAAGWLARGAQIPRMERIAVTLEYVPRVRRNRDSDNLAATVKPAVDGLVDANVVPDDNTTHVVHHEPIIREPDPTLSKRGVFLIVEELGADDPGEAS